MLYLNDAPGPVSETDQRMFLRCIDEMRAAGKEIMTANGHARVVRALTKADGLGFSFSDVNLTSGASTVLWYKHHRESNYIFRVLASSRTSIPVNHGSSNRIWPITSALKTVPGIAHWLDR